MKRKRAIRDEGIFGGSKVLKRARYEGKAVPSVGSGLQKGIKINREGEGAVLDAEIWSHHARGVIA